MAGNCAQAFCPMTKAKSDTPELDAIERRVKGCFFLTIGAAMLLLLACVVAFIYFWRGSH